MTRAAIQRVAVVLNGHLGPPERLLALLDCADRIVAADGGANWLLEQGRTPDLLVGDLDSVRPEVLAWLQARGCQIQRHPPQKDETDAELALAAAAALEPQEIAILGALGGRMDHALANLALLAMPALRGIHVRIWDDTSLIWLVQDESEIEGAPGDLVSLLPWGGDARGIVTEGLAYPLQGETLRMGPSRGVSNVLVGRRARVRLQAGSLLVVHTPRNGPEKQDGC
jgi:thiamine pyrophosphokinase